MLIEPYNSRTSTYQIEEEIKFIKYEDLQGISRITQEPAAVVYCYNSKDPEYGMYYYYVDESYIILNGKNVTLVEIPSSSDSSYIERNDICYKYQLTDSGFFYFTVERDERILYVKEDQIIKIDLAAL